MGFKTSLIHLSPYHIRCSPERGACTIKLLENYSHKNIINLQPRWRTWDFKWRSPLASLWTFSLAHRLHVMEFSRRKPAECSKNIEEGHDIWTNFAWQLAWFCKLLTSFQIYFKSFHYRQTLDKAVIISKVLQTRVKWYMEMKLFLEIILFEIKIQWE